MKTQSKSFAKILLVSSLLYYCSCFDYPPQSCLQIYNKCVANYVPDVRYKHSTLLERYNFLQAGQREKPDYCQLDYEDGVKLGRFLMHSDSSDDEIREALEFINHKMTVDFDKVRKELQRKLFKGKKDIVNFDVGMKKKICTVRSLAPIGSYCKNQSNRFYKVNRAMRPFAESKIDYLENQGFAYLIRECGRLIDKKNLSVYPNYLKILK